MSRTIEAIMRHMAAPPNHVPHQTNGTEKLEKDVTVKKQRYVWFGSEIHPHHRPVSLRRARRL
jgi:hypothetical protein